jgi:hypothetical protein
MSMALAPAHDPPVPRWQLLGCGMLLLAIVLLAAEGAAWLADARWHYRYRLLQSIASVTPSRAPVPAQAAVPWPRGSIYARCATPPHEATTPYVVGGRTVAGADLAAKQRFVRPSHLKDDPRPRVFILGGSAAFGYPYRYEDSAAGLLQDKLGAAWRVVNAAQVFWSSGRLVPVMQRIADSFSPAAVIIYSGNNEWIHWMDETQPWMDARMLTLYRTLSASRLQALFFYYSFKRVAQRQDALRRTQAGFRVHEELEGWDYALAQPRTGQFDAAAYQQSKQAYLRMFSSNLTLLVRMAQACGAHVVLTTVPFNYKLAPAWKHPQPHSTVPAHAGAVTQALRAAAARLASNDYAAALTVLAHAQELDPCVALLHYLRGASLEGLGHHAEAEAAYAQCREHMTGNLGARLSINATIRTVADETGATLVDAAGLFDAVQHARKGHYNTDMMCDDCHPSRLGQQVLAAAWAAALTNRPQAHQ